MSIWDVLLIVSATVMGTVAAYLRHPEHKAFLLMLPFPFTFAVLALSPRLVDATNVLSLAALFGFNLSVWLLHARWHWPIVPAIAVSVAGFCAVGMGITALQPTGDRAFWWAVAGVFAAAVALIRWLPHRQEPHHRTPLPVWVKLPAVALVVTGIVAIKRPLGGFLTTFPMVGVVVAYEARYSLWTLLRRIPWVMLMVIPLVIALRLTQVRFGLGVALTLVWVLTLAQLWAFKNYYYSPGEDDET